LQNRIQTSKFNKFLVIPRVHCNNPLVIVCVESTPPTVVLRRRRRSLVSSELLPDVFVEVEEESTRFPEQEESVGLPDILNEEEYTAWLQSLR
jgi:hypothetical protein